MKTLTEECKNNIRKGLLKYYTKHEKKVTDIMGEKFGKLTVIKRSYNKNHRVRWLCKCECGKETIVDGANLRRGSTKSCGCWNIDRMKLKPELAGMRYVFYGYRKSAKKRGLKFTLTEEQFAETTQQNCYYCGTKPKRASIYSKNNGIYIYNGLDRIDNNKGYTIDNVVPCCTRCNYAKKNFTLNNYKEWIKKSYTKMFC